MHTELKYLQSVVHETVLIVIHTCPSFILFILLNLIIFIVNIHEPTTQAKNENIVSNVI